MRTYAVRVLPLADYTMINSINPVIVIHILIQIKLKLKLNIKSDTIINTIIITMINSINPVIVIRNSHPNISPVASFREVTNNILGTPDM